MKCKYSWWAQTLAVKTWLASYESYVKIRACYHEKVKEIWRTFAPLWLFVTQKVGTFSVISWDRQISIIILRPWATYFGLCKSLDLSTELVNGKLATVKKLNSLWWSANTWNISFQFRYDGQFALSTQSINPKICVSLPHRRNTTVSLETNALVYLRLWFAYRNSPMVTKYSWELKFVRGNQY